MIKLTMSVQGTSPQTPTHFTLIPLTWRVAFIFRLLRVVFQRVTTETLIASL
jgi:hypothetical protein